MDELSCLCPHSVTCVFTPGLPREEHGIRDDTGSQMLFRPHFTHVSFVAGICGRPSSHWGRKGLGLVEPQPECAELYLVIYFSVHVTVFHTDP